MESTDGTGDVLQRLGCKVLDSEWVHSDWRGDQVLVKAFNLNLEVCGDVVVFFEADEVLDDSLIHCIRQRLDSLGPRNFAVWRLQLEQNFQRCRWYPYPVHRVFPKGQGSYHLNPVLAPAYAEVLLPEYGFLWDCAACFRDNWQARRRNQAELWGASRRLRVAEHFAEANTYEDEAAFLAEPQWTWQTTPFAIPRVLLPLVGKTKYEVNL
jgi:hypothetical protein